MTQEKLRVLTKLFYDANKRIDELECSFRLHTDGEVEMQKNIGVLEQRVAAWAKCCVTLEQQVKDLELEVEALNQGLANTIHLVRALEAERAEVWASNLEARVCTLELNAQGGLWLEPKPTLWQRIKGYFRG